MVVVAPFTASGRRAVSVRVSPGQGCQLRTVESDAFFTGGMPSPSTCQRSLASILHTSTHCVVAGASSFSVDSGDNCDCQLNACCCDARLTCTMPSFDSTPP